jgi:hypothetical protein
MITGATIPNSETCENTPFFTAPHLHREHCFCFSLQPIHLKLDSDSPSNLIRSGGSLKQCHMLDVPGAFDLWKISQYTAHNFVKRSRLGRLINRKRVSVISVIDIWLLMNMEPFVFYLFRSRRDVGGQSTRKPHELAINRWKNVTARNSGRIMNERRWELVLQKKNEHGHEVYDTISIHFQRNGTQKRFSTEKTDLRNRKCEGGKRGILPNVNMRRNPILSLPLVTFISRPQ